MKYIFAVFKFILFLVIILTSVVIWSVYTQSGRDFLAQLINIAPLPRGVILELKQINSIFPLHLEVTRFTLQEDEITWFDMEEFVLRTDALQYFKDKTVAAEIVAEKLLLRDLPAKESPEGPLETLPSADALDIIADVHISIHSISLDGYVDGIPIDLQNCEMRAHYAEEFRLNWSGQVINFGEPILFNGDAEGNLDNFQAHFSLHSKHLEYQEYDVERFVLHGEFDGLPSQVKGKITFRGNPMKLGEMAGNINIEHKNDNLHVGIQSIKSEYFNGNGSLHYTLSNGNASADLNGNLLDHSIPDMYSLKSGEFDIRVRLEDDILSGSAKINANAFKGYDTYVDTLSLKSTIGEYSIADGLSLHGSGQLNIEAQGVKLGDFALDSFSLEGSLNESGADFNMTAMGPELSSELSGSIQEKDLGQLISVEKSRLEYNKVKIALVSPTEIPLQDGKATLSKTQFTLGEGSLSLSGTIGVKSLDLQANFTLPLEPFAELFMPPEHFLQGELSSNIHIQGDLDSPDIKGELVLADGVYENIEYGAYINDIQSRIDATGKRIDITSFRAKSHNEGDLSLSGSVDFASDRVDVSLKGSSFKLLDSELLEASVKDMSLNLYGRFDELKCTGHLLFEKGSLDLGVNQAPEIKQIKECEKENVTDEREIRTEAKYVNIELDVDIGSLPQFKVYGRGLDSLWGGELQVRGSISEPLVSGEVGLERGSFKLLNTVMDLEEGNVVFSGTYENIPYFKVVATTENSDYKMKVVIRGTPEEMYFDFSSVPALPRDEIISQILFGKLSKELTALEAVQLARSVAALTGGGSSMDIMGELSNALGVDLISVDFDQKQSTASIHIEKRLNDKVKIITDQSSDITESSVGVEVKVLENVTLNTEHGLIVPNESVSINYKVDY